MPFPPLVQPLSDLPDQEIRRQAHQLILSGHGSEGQRRLAAAKVLVIGADEIGAPLIAHLADCGIGLIGIADGSTLNPWDRYLGIPGDEPVSRASAWAHALERTQPTVRTVVENRFDITSARDMIARYDVIVCAGEDLARSQLVDDVCAQTGKPFVWGDMNATTAQTAVFWHPHGPGLRDLFPTPPAPYFRGMAGVLKVLGAWAAVTLATEVVKLLTGVGEPLVGRVMRYDAMAGVCTTTPLDRDPGTAYPAGLTAAEPFFGLLTPEAAAAARESTISVEELKALLDCGEPLTLVDVRERDEYDFAHIPGSVLLPKDEFLHGDAAARLPRDRKAVLLCRAGIRSAEALAVLKHSGHPDAVHVGGGILAWAERIDPTMPAY